MLMAVFLISTSDFYMLMTDFYFSIFRAAIEM